MPNNFAHNVHKSPCTAAAEYQHYVDHSPLVDIHRISREENSNKHGLYQIHLKQFTKFSKELV